jgi:chromosome segregation ATPase
MDTGVDIEKRVSMLEAEMTWASGTVQDIKRDLEIVKNSQFQMLDRISSLQAHTDERISSLHAHMDERFSKYDEKLSSLQTETIDRISSLQAHMDERFSRNDDKLSAYQTRTDDKFISIHKAISDQTKWILTVILAAATLASVIQPLMMKWIN